MKTILAPVDFSSVSDQVVKAAFELAAALGGRVVVLHIVQPPVITSDFGVGLENMHDIVAATEKAASTKLRRLQTRLDKLTVPTETVMLTGASIPLILDQARKTRADFIVMGSHGHTALYDLLVGSTTQGVLKAAPCPVVVLPRKKSPAKKKSKR